MTALLEAPAVTAPPVQKVQRETWLPTRELTVDALALAVLTGLGVYGFSTVYDGPSYLVAAASGGLVGTVSALVWRRLRLPSPVGLLLAVVLALPVGVLTATAPAGLGARLGHLLSASITSWVRLLTTLPPAGAAGDLLVVPFLCGLASMLGGILLAGRLRRATWPALPPTVVLVLGALFGIDRPASAFYQGTVFVTLGLGWLALRSCRPATPPLRRASRLASRGLTPSAALPRLVPSLALLVVAALGASFVGPHLPFTGDRSRFVLRRHVEPPFDPRQYASPLTTLRQFHLPEQNDTPQLAVTGFPAGGSLRVAVLTDYDGEVYGLSSPGGTGGVFVRAGETLAQDVGPTTDVGVTVKTGSSVWLPVVGAPAHVSFAGDRADTVRESFRWDATTTSGVVPVNLEPGDVVDYRTVVAAAEDPAVLAAAAVDTNQLSSLSTAVPDAVKARAEAITLGQSAPFAQATALANTLRQGYYSDGGEGTGVAPGHSWARLVDLLSTDSPIGDAEQYAPAMAVMATSLGLPARVVMGYRPTGSGDLSVTGSDMTAWVEIAFDTIGWVPFYPTPDISRVPPKNPDSAPRVVAADAQPKPPVTPPLPPQLADADKRADGDRPKKDDPAKHHGFPAWLRWTLVGLSPLVVLALYVGLVAFLRRRRRERRRTEGPPADRVSGAWAEVLDVAGESGRPVGPPGTRSDAVPVLAVEGAAELARQGDALVFGRAAPTDDDATAYWTSADAVRKSLRPARWQQRLLRLVTWPAHVRVRPELAPVHQVGSRTTVTGAALQRLGRRPAQVVGSST